MSVSYVLAAAPPVLVTGGTRTNILVLLYSCRLTGKCVIKDCQYSQDVKAVPFLCVP